MATPEAGLAPDLRRSSRKEIGVAALAGSLPSSRNRARWLDGGLPPMSRWPTRRGVRLVAPGYWRSGSPEHAEWMKRQVVILGAGFGGLELSTLLSERLAGAVEVTLIDQN